jgi:hypothetical protein
MTRRTDAPSVNFKEMYIFNCTRLQQEYIICLYSQANSFKDSSTVEECMKATRTHIN